MNNMYNCNLHRSSNLFGSRLFILFIFSLICLFKILLRYSKITGFHQFVYVLSVHRLIYVYFIFFFYVIIEMLDVVGSLFLFRLLDKIQKKKNTYNINNEEQGNLY